MNIRKNARATPKDRAHPARAINRMGLKCAAATSGICLRAVRKWQQRFAAEGALGLTDRNSRPRSGPPRSCVAKIERATTLRRTQRLTYIGIAERVGPVQKCRNACL